MTQNRYAILQSRDSSPTPSSDAHSSRSSVHDSENGVTVSRDAAPQLSGIQGQMDTNKNKSIPDDATYPEDMRTNPATNHRRDAMDGADAEHLLKAALTASVSALPGTTPSRNATLTPHVAIQDTKSRQRGHARNTSSVSDFASSPKDAAHHGTNNGVEAERRSAQSQAEQQPKSEQGIEPLPRRTKQFDSSQSTAINTPRTASISNTEDNTWLRLQNVISAAQPGVTININIYANERQNQDLPEAQHAGRVAEVVQRDVRRPEDVRLEEQRAEMERQQQGETPGPETWPQCLRRELRAAFIAPVLYICDMLQIAAQVLIYIAGCCTLIAIAMAIVQGSSIALEYVCPMKARTPLEAEKAPTSPFETGHMARKTCTPFSTIKCFLRVATTFVSVSFIVLWLWSARQNRKRRQIGREAVEALEKCRL